MAADHCPNCGSTDLVSRTVNDRLRAADPRGETFEIALQLPAWSCQACKLCWQAQEAAALMEAAYQKALSARSPGRATA
jgi:hypothetical protein